jgi:hypothetical protein
LPLLSRGGCHDVAEDFINFQERASTSRSTRPLTR